MTLSLFAAETSGRGGPAPAPAWSRQGPPGPTCGAQEGAEICSPTLEGVLSREGPSQTCRPAARPLQGRGGDHSGHTLRFKTCSFMVGNSRVGVTIEQTRCLGAPGWRAWDQSVVPTVRMGQSQQPWEDRPRALTSDSSWRPRGLGRALSAAISSSRSG